MASFNCDGTTTVGNVRLKIAQMVGSSVLKHCFMTALGIGSKAHDFDVCWVIKAWRVHSVKFLWNLREN